MQKKIVRNQVRIIGGQWKRTPLTVIDAPGLRPTSDRLRETVFNWLNFLYQGNWQEKRCLDLFAGSGALGFEAASRGAKQVTLVELHPPAVAQLEKNRSKLQAEQIQICRGNALIIAQQFVAAKEQFELIFLDPPFQENWWVQVIPLCQKILKLGGLIYLESGNELTLLTLGLEEENWEFVRSNKAGNVFIYLLQCKNKEPSFSQKEPGHVLSR